MAALRTAPSPRGSGERAGVRGDARREERPLTLALSPQAGRGDWEGAS